MDKNILGHKIKWVWTMRKLNTPLSVSSYPEGVKMGQKFFKYPLHLSATWYDHGDIYFDEEEINLVRDFLRKKIKKDRVYPDKIAALIFFIAKKIDRYSIPNLKNKNLKQLIALFKKDQKLFLQMIGFMSYRGSVQMSEVLREQLEIFIKRRLSKINSLNSLQTYLEQLSNPLYKSIVAEEKNFALQLATNFRKKFTARAGQKN